MLPADKGAIAKEFYDVPYLYLETYLQCASVARNIAAHGGRFYNRVNLSPAVKFPKVFENIVNNKAFAYICAIYVTLPDEHKLNIVNDLKKVFNKHTFAQPLRLGFPNDWEDVLMRLVQ